MRPKPKTTVEVFAKQFHGGPIGGATITDLLTHQIWRTNEAGLAYPEVREKRQLDLVFSAAGFPRVQTASIIVPPGGLLGDDQQITFEVPGMALYGALMLAFGKAKKGTRHVVTTVLAAGANLHHNYGEPGVTVQMKSLTGEVRDNPLYLSATERPGKKHRTSWTSAIVGRRLSNLFPAYAARTIEKATTIDGGLIFPDVPFGYHTITAYKEGVQFSEAHVLIHPTSPLLVNASPPHGPKVV